MGCLCVSKTVVCETAGVGENCLGGLSLQWQDVG